MYQNAYGTYLDRRNPLVLLRMVCMKRMGHSHSLCYPCVITKNKYVAHRYEVHFEKNRSMGHEITCILANKMNLVQMTHLCPSD